MVIMTLLPYLLLILGGILLSQQAWSDYEDSHVNLFDATKLEIRDTLVYEMSEPSVSQEEKLEILTIMQRRLSADINTFCATNPLIGWQSFVDIFSEKIESCFSKRDLYKQLLYNNGRLVDYIKADHELAAIIAMANSSTDKNNKPESWKDIEPIWLEAISKVSAINGPEQFDSVKSLANGILKDLADAWQNLSESDLSKNRQKFQESHSNLGEAYQSLIKISDSSSKVIKDLTSSVEDSLVLVKIN